MLPNWMFNYNTCKCKPRTMYFQIMFADSIYLKDTNNVLIINKKNPNNENVEWVTASNSSLRYKICNCQLSLDSMFFCHSSISVIDSIDIYNNHSPHYS